MHAMHSHSQSHSPQPAHGHDHGPAPAAPPTGGKLIRWARFYDPLVWVMAMGKTRSLRALPLDLAALQPGEHVLEVGCGTGAVALAAARRVGPRGTVVGTDAAPEMIEVARRKARRSRPAVQFRVEPVEAQTAADGSFDVVLSSLMMHHLPGDLKRRALVEIRRVLRPGGRLVIVDFQPETAGSGHTLSFGQMMARLHGRASQLATVSTGLPALVTLLRETGFTAIATGPTHVPGVGYVRGAVPE
jgi:demethylmenaquinone methyltransferase/2-methoxy-6-polyprenyl-1,4-benzoquinol methylase/phosphoethanolamine N-methyltransferase